MSRYDTLALGQYMWHAEFRVWSFYTSLCPHDTHQIIVRMVLPELVNNEFISKLNYDRRFLGANFDMCGLYQLNWSLASPFDPKCAGSRNTRLPFLIPNRFDSSNAAPFCISWILLTCTKEEVLLWGSNPVLLNLDSFSRFCDMMSFKCQVGVLTLGESLVSARKLSNNILISSRQSMTAIKSYLTLCISLPTSWNDQGFS